MKFRRMLALGLLGALGLFSAEASAQRLSAVFEEAGAAFTQGRPTEAVGGYSQLVEAGVQDADVYHNLGTSLASAGRLGEAVLAFERALFLEPGAEDTLASLRSTRQVLAERLTRARGEVETQESTGLAEAMVSDMSEGALALAFLIVWALTFLFFAGWRFSRHRVPFALASVLGLCASLVVGALLFAKRGAFADGEAAIVTASNGALLEGPDPRSVERGDAYEGERARVLRHDGSYAFVRMGDGRSGWIVATDVGVIAPSAD